ncbi:MAG TPA: hypothetical protein VGF30_10005 [Bacteroidia bacterium]
MTQVILNIPDKELDFFMTLIGKFKYQLVKTEDEIDFISEKDKELVRSRIKTSKASKLLDWESEKNNFDGI